VAASLPALPQPAVSYSFFFLHSAKYLADRDATGTGIDEEEEEEESSEESTSDEEESTDSDDDDESSQAEEVDEAEAEAEAEEMPPAKKAAKPKPPKAAKAAKAASKKKKSKSSGSEQGLADDFERRNSLLVESHDVIRTKDFSVFYLTHTVVNTRFVFIRAEFHGSVVGSMIDADVLEGGKKVKLAITYKNGGELTHPDHLVSAYGNAIEETNLFLRMKMINRQENEVSREKTEVLEIPMPFLVETKRFLDPYKPLPRPGQAQPIDYSVYPLRRQIPQPNAPAPSTKFLTLSLRELYGPKQEQTPVAGSYFSPGEARGPSSDGSTARGTKRDSPLATNNMAFAQGQAKRQQGHGGIPAHGGVHSNIVPDDLLNDDWMPNAADGNPYPSEQRIQQRR
jgi:hypothetical protein